MSTQTQAQIDRNYARLAKLPDQTSALFSEDVVLVGQIQTQSETYAQRQQQLAQRNTQNDTQELF